MSISKQAWHGHLPINQITSAPLTSNNIICDTPSCVSASSSALQWADDSNIHDSGKQLFCYSSNPLWYITWPISTRSFNIGPAPASTTSKSSALPAACYTGRAIPSTQDFVPGGTLPVGRNTALKCTVSFIATFWLLLSSYTLILAVGLPGRAIAVAYRSSLPHT